MSLFGYFRVFERLSVVEASVLRLQKTVEESEFAWISLRKRCKSLLLQAERAEARLQEADSAVESDNTIGSEGEGASSPQNGRRRLCPRAGPNQKQTLRRKGRAQSHAPTRRSVLEGVA